MKEVKEYYYDEFENYLLFTLNYSHNTADSYVRDVKQLFNEMKREPSELGEKDIEKFIGKLGRRGLTVSTRNRKLSSIKRYYKYLHAHGYTEHNPAIALESGKKEQRLPKPVDSADIEVLLSKIDNLRDRVMVELFYATGMRREELTTVKYSDINFLTGEIVVIGKGNKERIIPVYPKALSMVAELFNEHNSDWLFPSRRVKGEHISNRQVNEIIKKWVDEAGLGGKKITPHSFRHSFCSHLFANGADIKVIRDMAGHASTSTTDLYTKIDTIRNRNEYIKFHPGAK